MYIQSSAVRLSLSSFFGFSSGINFQIHLEIQVWTDSDSHVLRGSMSPAAQDIQDEFETTSSGGGTLIYRISAFISQSLKFQEMKERK
jgi:hypothetical protein